MSDNKISPSGKVSLAVEVVRNLENVLANISRKRKLTTEHRRKLLKCAAYLKKKREAAVTKKIRLSRLRWISILRYLPWALEKRQQIKQFFVALMGGK